MTGGDGGEIARLAALPPLEYERERENAAERLGCRVAILDREVETARAATDVAPNGGGANTGAAGRALAILDIEPWHEPVSGASLLDAITEEICRYIVLGGSAADAVVLWAVATHKFDVFWTFPRLFVTAPEKGCGKSTLLDVLSRLVPRPMIASNITPAALFRIIERARPVLLLDEADTYALKNDDLRGVLDAGHHRNGSIIRCVGDDHEPRPFSAWSPVALAAIGKLPGTVEDRSIKINLRRRRSDESVEALRLDRAGRLAVLARMAARWAADHVRTLAEADPIMPSGIVNRAADNWRPLLAIADAAGGDWPERARRAALAVTREGTADADTPGVTLLADLRELFDVERSVVLFTGEILSALNAREDRPWSEYQRGRPMTAKQMADLLRPFGIPTNKTVRRGFVPTAKGYRAVDFAEAWERYLPPREAVTRSHTPDSAAPGDPGSVTPGGNESGDGSVTPESDVSEQS